MPNQPLRRTARWPLNSKRWAPSMKRLAGGQILGFIAFVCFVGIWQLVHHFFGQTEAFRMWGIGLLAVALVLSINRSIVVHIGSRKVSRLVGWRKAFVVLPAFVIGGLVSFYPHQVACSIALKRYVCS